jgi:hypothetical protein
MFKKKKNNTNYDRINGYVEAYIDAVDVLRKQKFEYGDVASITDMIKLISANAEIVTDKLLSRD